MPFSLAQQVGPQGNGFLFHIGLAYLYLTFGLQLWLHPPNTRFRYALFTETRERISESLSFYLHSFFGGVEKEGSEPTGTQMTLSYR